MLRVTKEMHAVLTKKDTRLNEVLSKIVFQNIFFFIVRIKKFIRIN